MSGRKEEVVNQRLEEYDIAKGIAIFLVVLGHLLDQTFDIGKDCQRIISLCHMPTFFFISGFFLEHSLRKHSKKKLVIKKIKQLIVPYICWSFVSFMANMVFAIRNKAIVELAKQEFLEIFVYSRSVWFLVVLFITQFICIGLILISECMKTNKYLVLFIGWIVIDILVPNQYFSMYKFKWLFPFLILGMYFGEHKEKFIRVQKYKILSLLYPLICYVVYVETYYKAYLEFAYYDFKSIICGVGYYLSDGTLWEAQTAL